MKFDFEKLDVWQIAFDLSEKVYSLTKAFPASEIYGITNQLRRASLSISLNIAEGKGRYSTKEFKQFLFVARGSLYETVTLLRMCLRLRYITEAQYDIVIKMCETIQSKLSGLSNYLRGKNDVGAGCSKPRTLQPTA
jgi:four helix bundle protein